MNSPQWIPSAMKHWMLLLMLPMILLYYTTISVPGYISGDDYDVDKGVDDDDVVDNDSNDDVGCDSDGFLTALTEEQMCTQSSITGLPNLLTRIIRFFRIFQMLTTL